jgi:hypothetical protein
MTDACIIKGADVNDGKLNVSNLLSQIVEYGDWITTIKLVHVITMCKERVITEYDDINALKYFNNNLIIKSIIGPFLGLDAERVSLSGFMKNIYSVCATDKKSFSPETTMLSKYPTQESLFIPWKKFLEDRGVKIYTKSALEQIKTNNNLISSVVMNNNNSIVADEYVFACSISPLIRAMQTNPYFISRPTFSNLVKLEQNLQLYFTMNLYLKEELGGTECTELVIVDAPWMPIIQKKRTWKDGGYLDKCANNIKDVWNIGLLDNIVGTLHKKILSKCSKEEAIEEGFYQLKQSEYIKKILAERGYESLDDVVVDTEVWYEFQNGPDGMLISTNPKFSLNVGNHKYIPKKSKPDDMPANASLAGYFVDSTKGGASMEASCETGMMAAKVILEKYDREHKIFDPPYTYDHWYLSIFIVPIVILDYLLYVMSLPPISIPVILFALVIFYLIKFRSTKL